MTRRWLALFLCALSAPLWAAPGTWSFAVSVDGRPVGTHRFVLRDTQDGQELQSDAQFEVRVLRIALLRYRHHATEVWQNRCLRSLHSQTQTNGRQQQVSAQYTDCPMSFAYWNPDVLQAHQLINSQSGVRTAVSVQDLGLQSLRVRGSRQLAHHYLLSGPELAIDLWYTGRDWVGLDSITAGGHRLHYELL